MDYRKEFKDKKITVVRIGLLGRGVGDAAFLAECGADVLVVDDAPQEVMQPSVDVLKKYKNITFKFGPYDLNDFTNCDMVLKGAGTPIDSPEIAAALEAGVPVEMSASLFARLAGIPVVGVTGTRGKSTVTHMIHHVLCQTTEPTSDLGLNHSEGMVDRTIPSGIVLGGNVRGVSNLQLLKEVQEDSIAVMELDSWQLQGFGYAKISPHIAIFTNFMDDHLNYYHNDRDAYFADKANIFLYQEDSDVLVTTPEVFERAKEFAKGKNITLGQEVVLADASVLPEDCLLSMPGEHNRLNAALAYEALKATSLTDEEIFDGLASFPGVPGRLEYLGEKDGVKIYNDNNATTPQATLAALETLGDDPNAPHGQGEKQNIVLIMGGADKGLDVSGLLKTIPKYCKKVILLPGTGTDRIKKEVEHTMIYHSAETLEAAVEAALNEASGGDIVLFSPAFASFGLFKNEYDRGDQFVAIVGKL